MLMAVLVAIIAVNLLVLVHEFGHFLIAKRKGIIVDIFSIGFGPKLFGFIYKGTEYRFSIILFGGYVKFKGDELEEMNATVPGGYFSVSPWKRIQVCFAGGFFNILLAWFFYTVIFFGGKPVTKDSLNTVVGEVKAGSAAEKIGIIPDDRIISINGKPVRTWEELVYSVAFSRKNEIELEIERNGQIIRKQALLIPEKDTGLRMLGIYSKETIVVYAVLPDSPAEKAGLKPDDKIISINGKKVYRLEPLIKTIRDNENKEIVLTVIRDGKEQEIKTIPQKTAGKDFASIGFVPAIEWTTIYPKPWEQFWGDLVRTWRTLEGLVTRSLPVKAISGPVGIIGIIGISMQIGWIPLISIIALISLNLGIVNLLPIPVLDGGHILFNTLEIIRKKPLSFKAVEKIQNVFMGLIIMLFVYITYNDLLRFFKWK